MSDQEQANPAPVAVEKEYRYQPKDDTGRPWGGEQVIKYTTEQELIEKLTDQNIKLNNLNRTLNKRVRVGDFEKENLPENLQRINTNTFEFKPRDLTADEAVELSRDLLDPEKVKAATSKIIEVGLGAKPEDVRQSITETRQDVAQLRAHQEATLFVQRNPNFLVCPENFETITNWMLKHDLSPVVSNFEYAFKTLTEAGLLLETPTVREAVPTPAPSQQEVPTVENSQPPASEPSRIASETVTQIKRPVVPVASGLTRETASNDGVSINQSQITLADIEKMSAEQYRKALKDPKFAQRVNELSQGKQ